jgi:glycosyltransferase involved in cell wall biosynthesis
MIASLSFVFPMYNEIGNLERTVREATEVGRRITPDLEIVVVDDASTDGSGELADRLAQENPHLRVVHHPVNRKLGGALKSGFATATCEWVLYIDSDLPIRMEDALGAVPLTDQADMVIGYRMNRCEGPKREVMSWCYNRLIRLAFGLKVRDVNFAFKLFRRELLELIRIGSEGSFIDAELLLEARRAGARIAEIGLNYYPRVAGTSTLARPSVVLKLLGEMLRYGWQSRRRARVSRPVTEPGAQRAGVTTADRQRG